MGGVVGAVGRVAGDASLALAAILFAIAVFIWALFVVRKLSRDEAKARRRITELEVELNEAEAALTAEPNILMIWRGRALEAERIVGDMRGIVTVPQDAAMLLDFPRWLEPEFGVDPRRGARRHAGGGAPVQYRGQDQVRRAARGRGPGGRRPCHAAAPAAGGRARGPHRACL